MTFPIGHNNRALTEFTLFPGLPLELRQKIWFYSLPAPRAVVVTLRPAIIDEARKSSSSSIGTLSANRESRAETLREYGVVLFSALPTALLIGKNDTIKLMYYEFMTSSSTYIMLLNQVALAVPGEIEKMEIINNQRLYLWITTSIQRTHMQANLRIFSGLRELKVSVNFHTSESMRNELLRLFQEVGRVVEVTVEPLARDSDDDDERARTVTLRDDVRRRVLEVWLRDNIVSAGKRVGAEQLASW